MIENFKIKLKIKFIKNKKMDQYEKDNNNDYDNNEIESSNRFSFGPITSPSL